MQSITPPLVALRGAGVARNGRWLVRDVDLSVAPGEIVTLIGPNGGGKSTTVRLALGLIRPTRGTATRRPGLTVGYVPQSLGIDWTLPLTVDRFMRLTNRLDGSSLHGALERVGIAHLAGREMRHLSGGEFQRALLARAIARRPDLLVLDEPVQGVDISAEAALYRLIASLRDELGCGILLVSHDLHLVMAATDTVLCLNGHVCCTGTPHRVATSPAFQSLFGARGAAAYALYAHHHDHAHDPEGAAVAHTASAAGVPSRMPGDA